jgi:hypothetical protein
MPDPENDELSERELDAILPAWKAPAAPARLRAAVFPEARVRWWNLSVRVPLPLAACLVVLLVLAAWRWSTPRTIYRETVVPVSAVTGPQGLRPVTVLEPRIIKGGDVQN